MAKQFVVGDRETGVLFVQTDPPRAFLVSRSDIEREAATSGGSFDETFAAYARGAAGARVADDAGTVADMIAQGRTISDVAFCLSAELDVEPLFASRQSSLPIEGPMAGRAAN